MKRWYLIAILILSVVFRVWISQPTWIHWDENYYINIFQNFVDRGELTPYMWRLGADTNIIAGSGTGYGIYLPIGWMSLFGGSLVSLRALMIAAGLVSAGLYYLIAKKWWGSETAGIAALVYGLVSANAFFSLVGRMDALGNLSYSLLLLLHIYAVRQEKKWPHFFVGVAAILTVEVHTLGLLYLTGLTVYYTVTFVQTIIREKKLNLSSSAVFFFLGAGIAGVLYIIVHILPDPQAYFVIPNTCAICQDGPIKATIIRIWKLIHLRPIDAFLVLLVLFTTINQRKSHQHYLWILLGYFLGQIIFNPPSYIQYAQHLVPLLSIGIGGTVVFILSQLPTEKQSIAQTIFLITALLVLGFNWVSFAAFDKLPFPNAYWMPKAAEFEYIQEYVPESTVVVSSALYFYPLRDYRNFLAFDSTLEYGLTIREESKADFLTRMDPKVFVMVGEAIENDPNLQTYVKKNNFMMVTENLWVTEDLFHDSEITR